MEVIPAIDLKSGRCVRLYQGDYQQETVFSEDPVAVAQEWQDQGACRLHLVDLDGAAQGNQENLETITAILRQLTIPVQVGGGIRAYDTAQNLISLGVDRVVIGTAAIEQPSLVQQLCQDFGGSHLIVAVDAREGQVAIKGWRENTSVGVLDLARQMGDLGVPRLLYTDISRDGTLSEPNFDANRELVANTGLRVLASGGVASLEHLRRLAETGVEGAVVGQALYTGDVSLPEAIRAASSF
ncbi:MAG: 1-(5-phosphoribosyl)-5-[(5-phosphoribosylamino)methylideneamino]imidazole-4-carboxamide isomerase [Dehalococcoidia bacterium]